MFCKVYNGTPKNVITNMMTASDNGFETRAFYQEGMSLTTETILVQSTLSSSFGSTKFIIAPILPTY
jgi:hypothetical protein